MYADVNLEDIDEAMGIIKTEIRKIVDEPMDDELLEKSKMKILLQNVQGYESNAQFADYYASDYVYFKEKGHFQDVEARIEAVTAEDIARVASKYLSLERGIEVYETPSLTSTQFYVVLTVVILILLATLLYLYSRAHSRIAGQR